MKVLSLNLKSSSSSCHATSTNLPDPLPPPPLLSIASGWSSRLHLVSTQSCCMLVLAGRPAFARPREGVHRSISLMSSSPLLQHCSLGLVLLTWIVFVMGGKWPYSCYFLSCCLRDLFNIARRIWNTKFKWTLIYLFDCLFVFYGTPTFAGYLMPNPCLYK